MANIIFMPHHWAADTNATFALAKKLQSCGHSVYYFNIPDSKNKIRAQELEFIPIFSHIFPEGSVAKKNYDQANGKYPGFKDFILKVGGMCDSILEGEIVKASKSVHPDL